MANQRIVIIGTTGAGKSTLARQAADRIGAPHIELDRLFWLPGWVSRADDDFRAVAATALAGDRWTVDGNYTRLRDLIWGRADTVVWLDPPIWTAFGQLLRRTARRIRTNELLWGTNTETLGKALSTDSILVWFFRTYGKNRRRYRAAHGSPGYPHLSWVHIQTRVEADRWLATLDPS